MPDSPSKYTPIVGDFTAPFQIANNAAEQVLQEPTAGTPRKGSVRRAFLLSVPNAQAAGEGGFTVRVPVPPSIPFSAEELQTRKRNFFHPVLSVSPNFGTSNPAAISLEDEGTWSFAERYVVVRVNIAANDANGGDYNVDIDWSHSISS